MSRRHGAAAAAVCLFWSVRTLASDPVKIACANAAEASQNERIEGHLVRALEEALKCEALACPALVREDCRAWHAEIEQTLPSVAFRLHDVDGTAMPAASGATLSIDGAPSPDGARGLPVRMDPGRHEVVVEAPGWTTATSAVDAAAGERGRVIGLALARAVTPGDAPPAPPSSMATATRSVPAVAPAFRLALVGVGIIGAGVFFAASEPAYVDVKDLRSHCAPTCSSSDVSSARTRMIIGDASLGVGLVSAVVASWLTFVGPRVEVPITVEPTAGGVAFGYSRVFW